MSTGLEQIAAEATDELIKARWRIRQLEQTLRVLTTFEAEGMVGEIVARIAKSTLLGNQP